MKLGYWRQENNRIDEQGGAEVKKREKRKGKRERKTPGAIRSYTIVMMGWFEE
jgi:hypothetical protein